MRPVTTNPGSMVATPSERSAVRLNVPRMRGAMPWSMRGSPETRHVPGETSTFTLPASSVTAFATLAGGVSSTGSASCSATCATAAPAGVTMRPVSSCPGANCTLSVVVTSTRTPLRTAPNTCALIGGANDTS